MKPNEALITTFYNAFTIKDYITIQNCYADNAQFSDPVFPDLTAAEVRKMWEMLLKNGKDLQIIFYNVKADDENGFANWEAAYSFSLTGNKVTNKIRASFTLENGKIVRHKDYFNFYSWSRQAFGITGVLIGWTHFFKNRVRQRAAENLKKFIANH